MQTWLRCAVALLLLVAVPLPAQETSTPSSSSENSKDTTERIKQLEQSLQIRDQAILSLQRRVEALERQAAGAGAQSAVQAQTTNGAAPPISSLTPRPSTEQYAEEERMARLALDRALINRGGILLPKWTMEVDHSITYYSSSSNSVSVDGFAILPVLVVGDIMSEKVKRDVALGALTARIGLPKDFQFEVRMPYGYESERHVWADGQQYSSHTLGIADLELAVIKQIKRESASWPALLTSARWKSTTGKDPFHVGGTTPTLGNGFHAIQGSLTAVKTSDPAILFGGFSYTANLSGDKGIAGLNPEHPEQITLGHVNPGDAFGFNVGAAMAINPETSLNAAWQQSFTRSSTLNHARVPGSFLSEGMLRLGSTYMYSPGRVVDLGMGIGLTRDSPDFQFSISFPLRFSLKRRGSGAAAVTERDKRKETAANLQKQPNHNQ